MLKKIDADGISAQRVFDNRPAAGYRLVTRSDMDGLVCAVLLKELGLLGEITFVHPKDMQDGKVAVSKRDISTNLPYVPGVFCAFDHHDSESVRLKESFSNHVIDADAPSAARVVYDFFGGQRRFPTVPFDLMAAVDKADMAQFDYEDVLRPKGWVLLSFLMDSRTGLGRFREFRISNYQLMMDLIDFCREQADIDRILELPDVKDRVDLYFEQQSKFVEQIRRCTRVDPPMAILDLRGEETVHAGNRFMVYALYPEANISCHVMWGRGGKNVMLAVGKSIFDRSNATHIGDLMLEYGGGGHAAAGTCQVESERADAVLAEILRVVQKDAGVI